MSHIPNQVIRAVVLSLSLFACVVNAGDETTELSVAEPPVASSLATSEVSRLDPTDESSWISCTPHRWECIDSCIFGGGQNVVMMTCDGFDIVVEALPCTTFGCF